MSERRALVEWCNGQTATLSASRWRLEPPDELLAELLNSRVGWPGRSPRGC